MVKTTYYKNRPISLKRTGTSFYTKVTTVGSNHSLDSVVHLKLMANSIHTTVSIVSKDTPLKNY